MVYTICHSQQSKVGLHCLPFSVWAGSTPFTIFSILIILCTVILSSLIRVYIIFHSQQSYQGQGPLLFSGTVWSGSTLFAIHILIRVYNICHSQYDQGLHHLRFLAVWSRSTLFAILSRLIKVKVHYHSQEQSDQGLQCLPFSAV